jgi:hypothetical protein
MSNDLVVQNEDDGWLDTAGEAGERVLRGTLLKFSDWTWTKGKEGIEVPEGTQLVALATAAAWVKWEDRKPSRYVMRQPGSRLPEREELGDTDKADWPAGLDGQPKDPWQNTRFLYLVDPISAEAFTFSTSSWGGRGAVIDLADQIQRVRHSKPSAVPVVELRAQAMQTKFGKKSKPWLKVIDWRGGELLNEPTPPPAPKLPNRSSEAAAALDDALPW